MQLFHAKSWRNFRQWNLHALGNHSNAVPAFPSLATFTQMTQTHPHSFKHNMQRHWNKGRGRKFSRLLNSGNATKWSEKHVNIWRTKLLQFFSYDSIRFIIQTSSSNQKMLTQLKREILFAGLRWQIWFDRQQRKQENCSKIFLSATTDQANFRQTYNSCKTLNRLHSTMLITSQKHFK